MSSRRKRLKSGVITVTEEVFDLENDLLITTPIPISSRGTKKEDAISVEYYTHEKELQRSIMASMLKTQRIIDLSLDDDDGDEDEDDDVKEIKPFTSFRKKPFLGHSVTEIGQSSNSRVDDDDDDDDDVIINEPSPSFVCEICVEPKLQSEIFKVKGCAHSFCSDCMSRYVGSKLQENITSIGCPEMSCTGVLEPEFCRSILPTEVFDRWGNALCESLILGSEKFYCPFKDCSALIIDEGGGVVIRESECPYCRRMFCAQCKVPWHSEIGCKEFQSLNADERGREDIMLRKLAEKKKWQRCPNCKYYVEKSHGCLFMKCRNVRIFLLLQLYCSNEGTLLHQMQALVYRERKDCPRRPESKAW